MPTVLRHGSWRLFFYSNEGSEPPHIHIESPHGVAKFWLDPVALVGYSGLRRHELRALEHFLSDHRDVLLRAWNEYFGD